MKKLSFIFQSPPYGSNEAREGLESLIALSTAFQEIDVFFLGEGILQLLSNQKPENIQMKNHSKMYAMLEYCDINNIFVCERSLQTLNIKTEHLLLDLILMTPESISNQLSTSDTIFVF